MTVRSSQKKNDGIMRIVSLHVTSYIPKYHIYIFFKKEASLVDISPVVRVENIKDSRQIDKQTDRQANRRQAKSNHRALFSF